MAPNKVIEPCDFVLFGTKGDLARRKLLPSLYELEKANLIHEHTKIIGVARYEVSQDEYVELVKANIEKAILSHCILGQSWQRFK